MRNCFIGAVALVAMAGAAQAIVINGIYDPAFGAPLAVQDTQTSFGSNDSLCAAYATTDSTNLYVFLSGKLNTGYERLALFLDTGSGGQNQLQPGTNFGSMNPAVGLKFDSAFAPTYMIALNGDGTNLYVDYADLRNNANSQYLGNSNYNGATPLGLGVLATVNNAGPGLSYGWGPLSPSDQALAASYTTGIELQIPLAAIGNPTGPFLASAFIAGGDGSTRSTQFLGGVGGNFPNGDYSPLSGTDLSTVPGNQYFVIPTPGAAGLLVLGTLAAGRRRR